MIGMDRRCDVTPRSLVPVKFRPRLEVPVRDLFYRRMNKEMMIFKYLKVVRGKNTSIVVYITTR